MQIETILATQVIAIDVTPILPGGENGGAKVFVLELIRGLALANPHVQFVLLTQAASHDELSNLDHENVRRVMVVGSLESVGSQPHVQSLYRKQVARLPAMIRRRMAHAAYMVSGLLKRGGTRRVLKQLGADLLFCPFTAPTFFDRRIPTVCTIYDLQFAAYPQFFEPEDVAYRKSTFLDACRKAEMLVAISDYSRESAIAFAKLAPGNVTTIALRMAERMPADTNEASGILDQLGLEPARYLLYPANFWRHKNHEMLLTAFGMACANGLPKDIKLVLTGAPGSRKEFIQAATVAMGLGDRFVFPGYLSDTALSVVLNHACGLVFPSLYEGFGLPVLEAMSSGVPVTCSNVTALPEVAGDAAIFFDPRKPFDISQALVSLVSDEVLRRQLIAKGTMRAKLFSDTDRMVSEYWQLFEDAMNRRNAVGQDSVKKRCSVT